jgi:hypothetical protein
MPAILFDDGAIGPNIDCFVIGAKTGIPGEENQYRTPKPVQNEYLNGFSFYLNGFAYLIRLGVEKRPIFAGDPACNWWLRLAGSITLPLEPYQALPIARERAALVRSKHPGLAYAIRDKQQSESRRS